MGLALWATVLLVACLSIAISPLASGPQARAALEEAVGGKATGREALLAARHAKADRLHGGACLVILLRRSKPPPHIPTRSLDRRRLTPPPSNPHIQNQTPHQRRARGKSRGTGSTSPSPCSWAAGAARGTRPAGGWSGSGSGRRRKRGIGTGAFLGGWGGSICVCGCGDWCVFWVFFWGESGCRRWMRAFA